MATAVRVVANPAVPAQKYVLYANGYIKAIGGALPITQAPAPDDTTTLSGSAGSRPAPTWYHWTRAPAVALQITDWAGPGGYVLDWYGKVFPFGTAADIPGAWPATTFPFPAYRDFAMDPAANGKGYLLMSRGTIVNFGTGNPAVASVDLGVHIAKRLALDYTSKKYYVLTAQGVVHARNGAAAANVAGVGAGVPLWFPDLARSIRIYDWATGKGWIVNAWGRYYAINAALTPKGGIYKPNVKFVYDFVVIDDGTGANPLRLASLSYIGGVHEFVTSTAPTVTAGGAAAQPVDPTTDTVRPVLPWEYSDAEGDAQASYEVGLFTAAQYGIGGFDPAVSPATERFAGTDSLARSVTPTKSLVNATYRFYVRATDTAGDTSAWSSRQWVQNVTALAAPGCVPTASTSLVGISVALSGIAAGKLGAVQYHDADWDGVTWEWVRGGTALVPVAGNATVVDPEPRYGIARTYRALQYVDIPFVASPWSAPAAATVTDRQYTIVVAEDAAKAAIVSSSEFKWSQKIVAGEFWPVGRSTPIIVTDGGPKARRTTLPLWVLDAASRVMLESILNANRTLLLRDPFGNGWFVRAVEGIDWDRLRAAPASGEVTPMRDAHKVDLTVQQCARPSAAPSDLSNLATLAKT